MFSLFKVFNINYEYQTTKFDKTTLATKNCGNIFIVIIVYYIKREAIMLIPDMEIMSSGSAGTGLRFLMVPQCACSTPTLINL